MCPECGKESRQVWESGHRATHDTPAEPAGWRCLHCEAVYPEDSGARDDYAYEQRRDDDDQ